MSTFVAGTLFTILIAVLVAAVIFFRHSRNGASTGKQREAKVPPIVSPNTSSSSAVRDTGISDRDHGGKKCHELTVEREEKVLSVVPSEKYDSARKLADILRANVRSVSQEAVSPGDADTADTATPRSSRSVDLGRSIRPNVDDAFDVCKQRAVTAAPPEMMNLTAALTNAAEVQLKGADVALIAEAAGVTADFVVNAMPESARSSAEITMLGAKTMELGVLAAREALRRAEARTAAGAAAVAFD
jgi:hypothetical protein